MFESLDRRLDRHDYYCITAGAYDHLLQKRPEGYVVSPDEQPLPILPTVEQAVMVLLSEVGYTEPATRHLHVTTVMDFDLLLDACSYCLDAAEYQHRLVKQGGRYHVFEMSGLARNGENDSLEGAILVLLDNAGYDL